MIKISMQIEGKQTNKLIACAATCEFNAWMTSCIYNSYRREQHFIYYKSLIVANNTI